MSAEPILLVDDDPAIREFVALVLEDEGYTVVGAPNGLDALRRIEHQAPALILLDMHMPLMNGWDFAEAYRTGPPPHAPIIVMTAGHSAHDAAADIQASGVLPKPFDIDELIALVQRLYSGENAWGPGGGGEAPAEPPDPRPPTPDD